MKPGVVIFDTFSETLIFGMYSPSFSIAASLYTPPNTGELWDVMRWSPTPNESIRAPCSTRSRMRCSSREFETMILHPSHPASSSISLAFAVRKARSPESIRIPQVFIPLGLRTSSNALIAFGIPDSRTL